MFIEELGNRTGIRIKVKIAATEYYLERWEVRKVHEALTAIIDGWDAPSQADDKSD